MNTISFILNALLFLAALYILAFRLPANGRWNKEQVFSALRFFTVYPTSSARWEPGYTRCTYLWDECLKLSY